MKDYEQIAEDMKKSEKVKYISLGKIITIDQKSTTIECNGQNIVVTAAESVILSTLRYGKSTTWVLEKIQSRYDYVNEPMMINAIRKLSGLGLVIPWNQEHWSSIYPVHIGMAIKENKRGNNYLCQSKTGEYWLDGVSFAFWGFADGTKTIDEIIRLLSEDGLHSSRFTVNEIVDNIIEGLIARELLFLNSKATVDNL